MLLMAKHMMRLKGEIKLEDFINECEVPCCAASKAVDELDLDLPEGLFEEPKNISASTATKLFKTLVETVADQLGRQKANFEKDGKEKKKVERGLVK